MHENRRSIVVQLKTLHCWAEYVASVCIEPQQCWQLLRIAWRLLLCDRQSVAKQCCTSLHAVNSQCWPRVHVYMQAHCRIIASLLRRSPTMLGVVAFFCMHHYIYQKFFACIQLNISQFYRRKDRRKIEKKFEHFQIEDRALTFILCYFLLQYDFLMLYVFFISSLKILNLEIFLGALTFL